MDLETFEKQSWASLPDSVKRQASADLLAGKSWIYWGRPVEAPSEEELMVWLPVNRSEGHYGNADKRRAVQQALAINPGASNRQIARETGTTHPFVAKLRRLRAP